MQSAKWEAMRQMKRLTDNNRKLRITLQSLPAVLAAIALIIYGLSFLPFSVERMKRASVLIEYISYYELKAEGKTVACFKTLNDSCMPESISLPAETTAINKSFIAGCWVNEYPFIPSCKGLIITTNPDSTACAMLITANRKAREIIKRKSEKLTETIKALNKKREELDYYLSVHNVNDDGYNTMADYADLIKKQKEHAEKVQKALHEALKKQKLSIRLTQKYTALHKDKAGKTQQITCHTITRQSANPFCLIQTNDNTMPAGASALYLHRWLVAKPNNGDEIAAASYPGCDLTGFNPEKSSAKVFNGTVTTYGRHDLPPLLVPDGTAIFSSHGQLQGISYKGMIIHPGYFGFRIKSLRQ